MRNQCLLTVPIASEPSSGCTLSADMSSVNKTSSGLVIYPSYKGLHNFPMRRVGRADAILFVARGYGLLISIPMFDRTLYVMKRCHGLALRWSVVVRLPPCVIIDALRFGQFRCRREERKTTADEAKQGYFKAKIDLFRCACEPQIFPCNCRVPQDSLLSEFPPSCKAFVVGYVGWRRAGQNTTECTSQCGLFVAQYYNLNKLYNQEQKLKRRDVICRPLVPSCSFCSSSPGNQQLPRSD